MILFERCKRNVKNRFPFTVILSEFVSYACAWSLTVTYRNYLLTSLARISLCIISVALRLTMNDCNYLHCNNQRHGYWLGEDNNVLFGHRAIMQDNGGVNINVKTDSGTSKLFARRLESEVSQIVKGWHVPCFAHPRSITRCRMVENSFLATMERIKFFYYIESKGIELTQIDMKFSHGHINIYIFFLFQKIAALNDD